MAEAQLSGAYEIVIREVRLTDAQNLSKRLQIGMQGKGNVIADERNIYGYLFRKFRKTVTNLTD